MLNNTDGSITLSQEEFEEVNRAYQALYDILSDGPTFIGDYFASHEDYLNMESNSIVRIMNSEKGQHNA